MVLILFGWLVLALGTISLGVVLHNFVIGGIGVGALAAFGASAVYLKLYTKTSASEAFYRTGMGNPTVIIDGGGLVVPVVHELTRVLLETMKLEVVRNGTEALICKDCLRVDVAAEFFIRVEKSEKGVKAAATSLGQDATNPERIKELLLDKLVSGLRTVAATMDLSELHQNREEFASRVVAAVKADIEPNGLFLETVTISQLDQTDVKNLKPDNVFDAQGLRKATEITQAQMVIKNKIERQAHLAITEEDVATARKVLAQEQDRKFAQADQMKNVANKEAERRREVAEFELAQQELVETRNVQKAEAIQAAEIKRQARLVEEEQARETAEVTKAQAVEVANRERQIAIANAEARRAEAEAEQRDAEAKEREAAERVVTAAQLEEARREKAKAVLKAEQDGEQQLIELQKAADAEAYTKTRSAQAEKEAAENEAAARIRRAQATLESKRHEAAGEKVLQMVPVEVDRERLEVTQRESLIPVEVDAKRVVIERERVEVLRQELEAKDEHQQAAIHLELATKQIEAGRAVGMEMAKSVGQFMSKGNFQIFGDPKTLTEMTERFSSGLGITQMVAGLQEGNPMLGGLVTSGLEAATTTLDAAKVKADEFLSQAKDVVNVKTALSTVDGTVKQAAEG